MADLLAIAIAFAAFAALFALLDGLDPRMSGAELFGLVVSALVAAYLVYALLRGERL